MSTDADALFERTILRKLRNDELDGWPSDDPERHLRTCPAAAVEAVEGTNGTYGCDTGCEFARLEAVVRCPHGVRADVEYGQFGMLADLIADMEAEEARG